MTRNGSFKNAAIVCGYLILGALAVAGWGRHELQSPAAQTPCAVVTAPVKPPAPNVLNELSGGTAGFIKDR